MRLGVMAENLIERLILKSNAVPERLLETQIAFASSVGAAWGRPLRRLDRGRD